jgi:hypothetical protein
LLLSATTAAGSVKWKCKIGSNLQARYVPAECRN